MSDFVEKPIKKMLNRQNPDTRLRRVEQRTGARNSAKVQDLNQISSSLGDIVGSRFIAPVDGSSAEPTDSTFSGSFLADVVQTLLDGDFWLANVSDGLTTMGFGPQGIFTRLFADVITQLSDDGTTYRKGRLGMTTLEGRSAPSWGLSYEDNSSASELITNGSFSPDGTGWTEVSGNWSYGANGATASNSADGENTQAVNVTAGNILQILYSMGLNTGHGAGAASAKVYADFYTGALGTGTLVASVLLRTVSVESQVTDYTSINVVPTGAASLVIRLVFDYIAGGANISASFDDISVKVNPSANWLGFEPIDGKLVSNMLDGGDLVGQIPVGAMTVPRVDEAKDKLVATPGAAGNVDVGTHGLITVFRDAYGNTDADLTQATSVTVSTSAKTVALTAIPLGKWGTVSREIYATIAGATQTDPTQYYLMATIGDNTTTTGTYNVSDASLVAGALLPTVNTTGSRPIFPKLAVVWGDEIITTVTVTNTLNSSQRYGYHRVSASGDANDGDEFHAGIYLAAGDYTLHQLGIESTNRGKIDYYIDNKVVSSGNDWYSGSADVNVENTASVTIETSGYHVLTCKINGKNASSSDYAFSCTKIWFTPAAY